MGIFNKLGSTVGKNRRAMAGVFVFVGLAAGVFFVGAWAGASGSLPLGPVATTASHATHSPSPHGPEHRGDGPHRGAGPHEGAGPHRGDGPHEGAGPHKAGPGMSHDKMSPNMPMDKPAGDKMSCKK